MNLVQYNVSLDTQTTENTSIAHERIQPVPDEFALAFTIVGKITTV